MPELPEVETLCRGLRPALVGRRIDSVHLARPDLRLPFPPRFAKRLTGRKITSLARRAKYLCVGLDSDETLVVHLGMSGRLTLDTTTAATFYRSSGSTGAHDHVVISLDSGRRLTFNDPRRFGLMTLAATAKIDAHPLFRRLGVEPLGVKLTGELLRDLVKGRRTNLKAVLLDQRVVAGIGNIYACEALHRAALSPRWSVARLSREPAERLARAITHVLCAAIEAGGSSLRDYVRSDGTPGYFQKAFTVYDREGEACTRRGCGGVVRRIVQSGRSTFYCPTCQR
jgi:formamidopyrimidine-DNA glycosylase